MTEVEEILDSRPLDPIMFDDRTQNEPLTPNHLILLRGIANLPPSLFSKKIVIPSGVGPKYNYLGIGFGADG